MFGLGKKEMAKIIQNVKKKNERNKSKQTTVFRRKLVYLKVWAPSPPSGKPRNQLIEEAARDEFTNICTASEINE